MDPSIIDAILHHHQMAYLLLNAQWSILAAAGTQYIEHCGLNLTPGSILLDDLPELHDCITQLEAVHNGVSPEFTLEHLSRTSPQGNIVYFRIQIQAYHRRDEPAPQFLALITDTTEQSQQSQRVAQYQETVQQLHNTIEQRTTALLLANSQLRRMDEIKTDFITIAAHELRNPLTPILGYVELLLSDEYGPLNAEQRHAIQATLQNVLRLRSITADLLDLARIETGRIELVLRPTDLRTLVELQCLKYKAQLASRNQQLTFIAHALPLTLCDEHRAAQIIGHLLSNASKYTPDGGAITIRIEPGDAGFAQVVVEDTGMGITKDDQQHLFNAFFRAHTVTTPRTGGTGLGLHIARLLIELHGGQIWFHSTPGAGSTFYVSFIVSDELNHQSHDLSMVTITQ